MKKEILDILKNADDYISGQELCEKLGVSRTAIWKHMNSLKADGYVIEGVNNKGYRLVYEPDVMTVEDIKKHLTTKCFGQELVYYDEIDSTNIRAKLGGEGDAPHGTLYVANEQVAGRGRRGRAWTSPKGTSISMTFLLRPDVDIAHISSITVISALAMAKAFNHIDGINAQIKWPNDVVINGRKVCGILTEMSSEGTDIKYVVVGIGINVYITEFPEELADKATSIKLENGQGCNRSQLTAYVANEFETLYEKFEKTQDLSFMIEEYDKLLVNRDKQVYALDKDSRTEYTALGLAPNGGLRVRNADGEESVIISGEVSVRGIYGYV
jgi:BirA family biotin operon repressor/biotin-[acetyl-CoA-carboxylase] ligase